MTNDIVTGLADLEEPLRKSAGLALTVRCFATSDEIRDPEVRNAIYALATVLLDELTSITTKWESVMGDVFKEAKKGGAA